MMNQLLAITHEIFSVFDCNLPLDARTVYLGISNVFIEIGMNDLFSRSEDVVLGAICLTFSIASYPNAKKELS